MRKEQKEFVKAPFSIKRFMASTIGHFILFSVIIGMAYLADPNMLAYEFLFSASGIAALMLGVFHGVYKREEE